MSHIPNRVHKESTPHQHHEKNAERMQPQPHPQQESASRPATAQRRPTLVSEQDATKMVSSFLFGWNPQNNENADVAETNSRPSDSTENPEMVTERQRVKVAPDKLLKPAIGGGIAAVTDTDTTTTTTVSSKVTNSKPQQHQKQQQQQSLSSSDKLISAITSRLDQWIPEDSEALRQSKVYQEAYKAIEWQRDNYVVGRDYANWRKKMRKGEDRGSGMGIVGGLDQYHVVLPPVPYEETALAHAQLANLAANFIPSPTVKQALVPLVVTLPCGPLLQPARNSLVNVIVGSQYNLDKVIKSSILTFLNNPANRAMIKNSTKGYIVSSATYRDGNGNAVNQVQTAME